MNTLSRCIHDLLRSQMLCVVSTVHADGSPESALVAFSESPDLEIVFGTFSDSRKFTNILRDPRVALTIGTDEQALQMEGTARVASDAEVERCTAQHIRKNPSSSKYAHDPKQRYIIVKPTWLRYTDYGTEPDTIEELHF